MATIGKFEDMALWQMGFAAGYQREVEPRYCPIHDHPSWEVVYHITGSGFTTSAAGRQKVEFSCGDLVINPPGVMHDQQMTSAGQDVCVIFTPQENFNNGSDSDSGSDIAFDKMLHVPAPSDAFISREMVALANCRRRTDKLASKFLDRRASALWMAIMLHLAQSQSKMQTPESYPQRARRYLRQNCCKIERVSDVAEHLGISEDYLRHCYSDHFGSSLVNDLKQARVEQAANLLLHSTLPLKIIASVCSLGSEQYFCTSFRQIMGCTPTAYRKRAGV